MFKKVLAFGLLVCVLTVAACSDDKEDEPPTATAQPAFEPEITYTKGFHDLEKDGANTWRWMSEEGVIRLKNTGKDMKLHLVGDVPIESLKTTPTYKITLNGEILEEFSAKAVDKEFVITAAKQGNGPTSEVIITSNKFFIPKQLDAKSSDERKLSFSLRQITWEVK
jgi:hypothetical protein